MMVLAGSYDAWLVGPSALIAILAAGAALDLAGRVTATRGRARAAWLADGALDAAGTPVRLAGTSLDITDRKLAEENQRTLLLELQTAVAQVKTLQGWIRICANCKRVLTDEGTWQQFESYVRAHSDVDFSHGICPDCAKTWSAAQPEGGR